MQEFILYQRLFPKQKSGRLKGFQEKQTRERKANDTRIPFNNLFVMITDIGRYLATEGFVKLAFPLKPKIHQPVIRMLHKIIVSRIPIRKRYEATEFTAIYVFVEG